MLDFEHWNKELFANAVRHVRFVRDDGGDVRNLSYYETDAGNITMVCCVFLLSMSSNGLVCVNFSITINCVVAQFNRNAQSRTSVLKLTLSCYI